MKTWGTLPSELLPDLSCFIVCDPIVPPVPWNQSPVSSHFSHLLLSHNLICACKSWQQPPFIPLVFVDFFPTVGIELDEHQVREKHACMSVSEGCDHVTLVFTDGKRWSLSSWMTSAPWFGMRPSRGSSHRWRSSFAIWSYPLRGMTWAVRPLPLWRRRPRNWLGLVRSLCKLLRGNDF